MGSLFSLPSNKPQARGFSSSNHEEPNTILIPFLPDEISFKIIARIPRMHYLKLKLVSRKWKSAITSSELFRVRKELKTTEEWLYILAQAEEALVLCALDPLSRVWQRLPPTPALVSKEESKMMWTNVIRGWHGQKDAIGRMPSCGCALGAVAGCLYILGGLSKTSVINRVWKYDPKMNIWQEVSSMTTARAFCKTAQLNGKLYVAGGVDWIRDGDRKSRGLTPLRSAEVFDPITGLWDPIPDMPFSKVQALNLPPDMAEMAKTIATGMSSYKGKLYVPQSIYAYLLYGELGGEMYDPETNSWAAIPDGMGRGWPAKKAGTKLSVVVNGALYALDLDHSSSSDNSSIKIYNDLDDSWNIVTRKVPIYDLNDAEAPYLFAGFLGKLYVIVKDSSSEIAVLEANLEKTESESPLTFDPLQLNPNTASSSSSSIMTTVETDVWRLIATKNFGAAELVCCQVLDS